MLTKEEIERKIEEIDHYIPRIKISRKESLESFRTEIELSISRLEYYQTSQLNKEFKKEVRFLSSKILNATLKNRRTFFFMRRAEGLLVEISRENNSVFNLSRDKKGIRKELKKRREAILGDDRQPIHPQDRPETQIRHFLYENEQNLRTRFIQKIEELNLNFNLLFKETWWTEEFENSWYNDVQRTIISSEGEIKPGFDISKTRDFFQNRWERMENTEEENFNENCLQLKEIFLSWISSEVFFSEKQYIGIPKKNFLIRWILSEESMQSFYSLSLKKDEIFFSVEHMDDKLRFSRIRSVERSDAIRRFCENSERLIELEKRKMLVLSFLYTIVQNRTPNDFRMFEILIEERSRSATLIYSLISSEEQRKIERRLLKKTAKHLSLLLKKQTEIQEIEKKEVTIRETCKNYVSFSYGLSFGVISAFFFSSFMLLLLKIIF